MDRPRMTDDADRCYRIVCSRDPRFDGWFVTAVTSTGIFCRPSCPARTPRRENVCFHPTAAAAVSAGFRACRRCRPDVTPGSPTWRGRSDVVARAMRSVAEGVVDREGVSGLALRLGYSERQLHRLLVAEVGAGPLALARVQRADTARLLLETTAVPVTEVAFAAGFSSVRQFNDTVRSVYAVTPSELRRRHRAHPAGSTTGSITIRLAARAPFDAATTLHFLGERAVPGIEAAEHGSYRRVLDLPGGPATVSLIDGGDHVSCTLGLAALADLGGAVARCRRLLDLDADPVAVDDVLGADPLLATFVAGAPGLRVPGHVDGDELAVRAVLGQQVSVAGARTLAGRVVEAHGTPLVDPDGPLTHRFPRASELAEVDPASFGGPRSRGVAIVELATRLANGDVVLDAGADRAATASALLAVPGIGPWTASYIAMRALGDPDAFIPGDLGVRRALERLGHPGDLRSAEARAVRWRPWRAYAVMHLWRSLALPAGATTTTGAPAPAPTAPPTLRST